MGQVKTGPRADRRRSSRRHASMHEHVFILSPEVSGTGRQDGTRSVQSARPLFVVSEVCRAGVSTIVDLTVVGLGRDVARRAPSCRAGRPEHRRRRGSLHLRRAGALFFRITGRHQYARAVTISRVCFLLDTMRASPAKASGPGILKTAGPDATGRDAGIERCYEPIARSIASTAGSPSRPTHTHRRAGHRQQTIFGPEGVDLPE